MIIHFSLDVALDAELDVTGPFTGAYFFEEARGLADATGLDIKVKESNTSGKKCTQATTSLQYMYI